MYNTRIPKPATLAAQRDREIAKLPPWTEVIRGTVRKYYLPCGRKNCRCRRDRRHRHGPYWYVAASHAGKTKMALIPNKQLGRIKRSAKAYHRLWKGLCRISELNLALARADR